MLFGSTTDSSISTARSTMRRLSADSSDGPRLGSPRGLVIATPRRIRFAPIIAAIVESGVTNTVGMPIRSISLASVDPQRVPVPQVPVSRTACTPSSFSFSPISLPNRTADATGVPFPVVTYR